MTFLVKSDCGFEYKTKAASDNEAVEKSKVAHETKNHNCLGFFPQVFNVDQPEHPAAPKDY